VETRGRDYILEYNLIPAGKFWSGLKKATISYLLKRIFKNSEIPMEKKKN
jgi:hypothetical protein